jgi:heterodisulfide reductase subunit A-like polyferredoxin
MKRAGLNEHLFAMANIRNHCSWIHSDNSKTATVKANDLVRMAVSRVASLEPLYKQPVSVEQSAMVVGGGPAGMNAALTLAEQGYPVHLVEQDESLGGRLRDSYFNIPATADSNPQTYLSELTSRVEENSLITTHLSTEVKKSIGFVGNFSTTLQDSSGSQSTIEHGVTIVATGGQEYRGSEYGYGSDSRIISQSELEKMLAYEGGIYPELNAPEVALNATKQIVMIQCVGPAEEYCARTCCNVALNNALLVKRKHPDIQIIVLYRDIRTYGFYERIYRDARSEGVIFLHYDENQRPTVNLKEDDQKIRVSTTDSILNTPVQIEADLLVLSMPIVPAEENRKLASTLKVPVDADGWFLEAHVKLRPVEFASDGIYLAGVAHYPKMLEESIVQAQAAASRAATILANPERLAGGSIARVDPELCVGCLTCVRVCPFDIPSISIDLKGVGGISGAAYIEPSVCQGCGTCSAACPAEAIELLHYRHDQLGRQVLSALDVEFPSEEKGRANE